MLKLSVTLFLFSILQLHFISHKSNCNAAIHYSQKNEFIGTWVYTFPFYYSKLKIFKTGRFTYYDGGCMGKSYTEGNWEVIDGKLSLTSFSKYQIETKSTYTTWYDSSKIETNNAGTLDSNYTLIRPMGIKVTHPDTSNIYFNKKLFLKEKNSLIELDKNQSKTDVKYVKK